MIDTREIFSKIVEKSTQVIRFGFIVLSLFFTANSSLAQDTVKIMSYNLLNYPGDQTLNREQSYKLILQNIMPDILVVQEVADAQAALDTFYNRVVSPVLPGVMKGTFIHGFDTDNGIFYRSSKFSFISNTAIHTALRDINEFTLVHTASGDTFRIYSVHLKASSGTANELARAAEVDSLRKVTNQLGAAKNFLVVGDFNIYNSNEQAYQNLILDGSNANGKFIDPITIPFPSNWNNAANAQYHTQSPRVRSFGGGATGGMDDRFDMILYSSAVAQSGGMYFVPGSFTIVGNDGNHFNDSINAQPNTAVSVEMANALHWASDHLPVYAKFTFSSSLAAVPAAQPTNLTFSNITASSMDASFSSANPPCAGYLVLRKAGAASSSVPVAGNSYNAGDIIGDAMVVYSGAGTSFLNTGLAAGTTYYYSIFSFNGAGSSSNYLTSNPLSGSQATLQSSVPGYVWVGSTTDFQLASNWNPTRTSPAASDILNFNLGGTYTVTNVPTQSIAQLFVTGGTSILLYAATGAARTLTISGGTGTDFSISTGSEITVTSSTACSLMCAAGATASISGNLTFTGGAHRFIAADTVSAVFQSGAVFTHGASTTGNPFGTTNLRTVVFASGSVCVSTSGANPFGAQAPNSVVIFQPGSWFRWNRTTGDLPSFANRTYANFEFVNCTATLRSAGSITATIDTLKVSSGSPIVSFYPGFNLKGDLIVNAGASFTVGQDTNMTIAFSGTQTQTLSGAGTLTFAARAKMNINNPAGVYLSKDITLKDSLTFSSGSLYVGGNTLTLDSFAVAAGNPSTSSMMVTDGAGIVRKVFTGNSTFTFPVGSTVGDAAYLPLTASLVSNGGLSSAFVSVKAAASKNSHLNAHADYLNAYWAADYSGITNPLFNVQCTYPANKIIGNESVFYGGKWSGGKWNLAGAVDTAQNRITISNISDLGEITAAGSDYIGGAAIVDVKAMPEGFYNESTDKLNMRDTLKAFAAGITTPYGLVDSSLAVFDSVTFTSRHFFRNLTDGNYYLVLRHRNSIETWSRQGGESLVKGTYQVYDFTNDSAKAYGANQQKLNSRWCLYSGDVNQDGFVDFTDLLAVDNDQFFFASGYLSTDINGDNFVDFSDLILTDNNQFNFIGTIKPGGKK